MSNIKPGTRSEAHFKEAEEMFLKDIEGKEDEDLYRRLYETLPPNKKRTFQEDIIDSDLASYAIDNTPITTSNRIAEIVDKDLNKKFKDLNIGKPTSEKAKQLIHGKVFVSQVVDYKKIFWMVHQTRTGVMVHAIEMAEFKSVVGTLYVLTNRNVAGGPVYVVHGHVFERYMQRSGHSKNITDAQKWLFKEMVTAQGNIPEDDLSFKGRLCRGRAFAQFRLIIPSGMLLGSTYTVQEPCPAHMSSGQKIRYLKTYVSMEMFSEDQDNEHKEVWDEIMASLTPLEKKIINSTN